MFETFDRKRITIIDSIACQIRQMGVKMKLYMDLHTHTIASGHGYSTLQENIIAAKEIGLTYLGLSEHAPKLPGGPHIFFLHNYRCIPREYDGLRLFCGVEANIMDYEGNLDPDENTLQKMDYVIASMHVPCVPPGTKEENTRASIMAMKNPYVKVLGHPDDSRYLLDREAIVYTAGEEKVAIEINNSSLHPKSARTGGRENILELLEWCKRYQVPVILGTDSHISYTIGHFEESLALLEEVCFPEELVLNVDPENIWKLVNLAK